MAVTIFFSHSGRDCTAEFPELVAIADSLAGRRVILDGELVCLDAEGKPEFGALRNRLGRRLGRRSERVSPVTLMIFDGLHLDGRAVRRLPYAARRELLNELGLEGPAWRVPRHFVGQAERLIEHYRDVLKHLDPRSASADGARALELAGAIVERAGGFEGELEDIESVAAHHQNNYLPLLYRQIGRDRTTMFAFARTVELEATSADRSVLHALEHAVAHQHLTRDLIPDHKDGVGLDLSFASEQWQRLVRPHKHPGRLDRRHFEAPLTGEFMDGR
jgi:hypothetical protein